MVKTVAFWILVACAPLQAQVFMSPFENAAFLGMGSASVALQKPINGTTNPAQLAQSPKMGVMAWSAVPYSLEGWQSNGFQFSTKIQKNSGIAIDVLHSGIEGYREQRAQLSYGRKLGEKYALGGAIQAMRVSADEYGNAGALTFLVGVMARPLPRLTLGAVIQNPVPQRISGETISSLLRLGAAWQPSESLVVSTEMQKDLARPAQLKAGVEYRPVQAIHLRLGMRSYPARTTFGGGFSLKNGLRLDFGSEWHPVLGFTPSAMIAWNKW